MQALAITPNRTATRARRRTLGAILLTSLATATGCFSERSFRFQPSDRPPTVLIAPTHDPRTWLREAHTALAARLPRQMPAAPLLTEALVDANGAPINVANHFGIDPTRLHTLGANAAGLTHTAQATGADASTRPLAPWPGFEDALVPLPGGGEICGRLGLARANGRAKFADAVIILPGLLGDNGVKRTRDLAAALVQNGIHALSLETRGTGRTKGRYPDQPYAFGTLEVNDLVHAAAWLQRRPEVRETGAIGFCWGANLVLLAAWEAERDPDHPGVNPTLRPYLPRPEERVLRRGVMAFSPVLKFEEIVEQCERRHSMWVNPVLESLQDTIQRRAESERHAIRRGSLADLISTELARTELPVPQGERDGYDYLRLMPYRGRPAHDKLRTPTCPVVIVQAANDPLTPAQHVAELIATTPNPHLAAIVLPGGGHIGFAPYARSYFYGLVLGFFGDHPGE